MLRLPSTEAAVFDIPVLWIANAVGWFLMAALLFRGVSHFPLGKMGDIIKFTGGTAMQCQKLKTYMETGRVVFLPAGRIRPNPSQPRKVFREEDLLELSESIRQHGVIQPLSVRRIGNSYELIAGERRLRSAKLAGLSEIPCIVMTMDEKESAMAAMADSFSSMVMTMQGISERPASFAARSRRSPAISS
jgi:hypothetical protein